MREGGERGRASTRVITVKCSRYPHCHRRPKRVARNVTGARLYLVTWYGFAGDNAKICATSLVNRNETRDFFFFLEWWRFHWWISRFSPPWFLIRFGTKSLTICPVDVILWFLLLFLPRIAWFSFMKLISEISYVSDEWIHENTNYTRAVKNSRGIWFVKYGTLNQQNRISEYQSAGTLINNSSRNWNFFGQFRFVWRFANTEQCSQVTIEIGRNNNRQMSYMGHEPVEIVSVLLA